MVFLFFMNNISNSINYFIYPAFQENCFVVKFNVLNTTRDQLLFYKYFSINPINWVISYKFIKKIVLIFL